ncbi:MAG: ribonuclease HII [Thaumarchaeota archaeon]|nr:ribonuclease HII [Nitrososphaerota archaeon]
MAALAGGVDEAGRGCVVGPLVVAGVSADTEGVEELKEIGVRDSKKLSPAHRATLYGEILKICARVSWAHIAPDEIDVVVATGKKYKKLNYLEALYFARVVDELEADTVTVDAADASPKRFEDVICTNLSVPCRVKAYHYADRDYPLVSAASIIAKVERDRFVGKLRERHGDFGSGYPSDPRTKIFFREWLEAGNLPPDWTRRSWKSWRTFERSLGAPY